MKEIKLSKLPLVGKYFKDAELSEKVLKEYQDKKDAIVHAQHEAHSSLELLGRTKIEVLNRTYNPFIDLLSRIEDIELVSNQYASVTNLVKNKSGENLKKAVQSGGETAATTAISYAAIGKDYFVLKSAANMVSTNATLNFLTGVSGIGVGVGGLGILGGLIGIPAVLFGGYFFSSKIKEKIEQVKEDKKKIKQFIEEANKAIIQLENIQKTSMLLHRILVPIEDKLKSNYDMLYDIIERASKKSIFTKTVYGFKRYVAIAISKLGVDVPDWLLEESKLLTSNLIDKDKTALTEIVELTQMLKNILDLSIINEEGVVPAETRTYIMKVKAYIKTNEITA